MLQELRALIELQKVDREIIALQRQIEETPSRVKTVEQPLLDARAAFDVQKKRSDEFLKKKKAKEQRVNEVADRISKFKARTSEIKTNKEYQAHLKEIETFEHEKTSVEDELLELMVQADEMTQQMKAAEDLVKTEEQKREAFARQLKAEAQELERVLGDLRAQRGRLVSGMQGEIYQEYMLHLETGQGLAIAEVRDNVCMGCHMNVPPQLYVEVRKGDQILNCPQCGRYLYYVDDKKEETEGAR